MNDWKRIGARSRSRGYRFEKYVEAELDWQRVPMSGSAGSSFGAGDVIDGYINGAGFWLAECKARTSESISVDGKWIEKARKDAERTGRFVVIITGTKHSGRNSKRPEAWVFLDEESFAFLKDRVENYGDPNEHRAIKYVRHLALDDVYRTKTTSRSGGFCVRRPWIDKRDGLEQAAVEVIDQDGNVAYWRMMTLEKFKQVIHATDSYVKNTHKDDD